MNWPRCSRRRKDTSLTATFSHIDDSGGVRMVDVTDKATTQRTAAAQAVITMRPETFRLITGGKIEKGNVFATARIAGILAAKKTASLIPMCHPLTISHASIEFDLAEGSNSIIIRSHVRLAGRTGVEMEALTAVTVAALTVYDMCKSADKEMVITDVLLLEKTGGKSGSFVRKK